MFTDLLYAHKFDIDTLLQHWCAAPLATGQVYVLNSENGSITTENEADMTESKFIHIFTPLPFASTREELTLAANAPSIAEDFKADIVAHLQTVTDMPSIFTAFDTNHAGGWLRTHIKNMVLDWLDEREMIPPSMRHVRLEPTEYEPAATPTKVTFS